MFAYNECFITVHLDLIWPLLGSYYMKPGSMFKHVGANVKVILNCSAMNVNYS